MSKVANIADARSRKLGTIGSIGKVAPKQTIAKEVAEKPKGKVKAAPKAPEVKQEVAKVVKEQIAKIAPKKTEAKKIEVKKPEVKAAPKKVEVKAEPKKAEAKRTVIEMTMDSPKKHSALYKSTEGESFYYPKKYMSNGEKPSKRIRIIIEEI